MNSPYRTTANKKDDQVPFWCRIKHKWVTYANGGFTFMESMQRCARCGLRRHVVEDEFDVSYTYYPRE
jgi:hypothetical protein